MGLWDKHPLCTLPTEWYNGRALAWTRDKTRKQRYLCAVCFTPLDYRNFQTVIRCKGCCMVLHAKCVPYHPYSYFTDVFCPDCRELG